MSLAAGSSKELFQRLDANIRGGSPDPALAVDCMEGLFLNGADKKSPQLATYIQEVGQLPMVKQEIQSRLVSRDLNFASPEAVKQARLQEEAFAQVVDLSLATSVLGYGSDPLLSPVVTSLAGKYGVLPANYRDSEGSGYYELKPVAGVNIIEQAKEYLAHSKKTQETLAGDPQSFIGYLRMLPPMPISIPGRKEFVARIGSITAESDGDIISTDGIFLANDTEAPFDAILQIDQKGRIKVIKKNYDLSNFNQAVQIGAPLLINRIIGNIDSQLTGIINKNIGGDWQVGRYGLRDKKMEITFVKTETAQK